MLLGLGVMVAVVAVMLAFPDTEIGRGLTRWLVETPARRLTRIKRGRAVSYALLAVIGLVLVMLFETEGMRLFGFMLPDTLVWFTMFDVGVFVDALLITGAILATNGLRAARAQATAVWRQVVMIVRRWMARARRVVRPASRPTGNISDDDRPAWAAQPAYRLLSMA